MGVVIRRYIDFLILLISLLLLYLFFLQQHPYFLFIFKNVFLLEEELEERRRMANCDFLLRTVRTKLRYYSDVIHSFYWKSAIEHDGGV